REREDKFVLVGRAPTANWVKFQAAVGKYNVRLFHDPRSDSRPDGKAIYRTHYRFQIQGPEANKVLDKVNGKAVPDIKFFHVDWINVGSRRVQALRHGMAGAPGLEIWGPYADKHYIQSTILEAARDIGVDLRLVGSRAYSTNTLESGWIPSPLPGIYSGDGRSEEHTSELQSRENLVCRPLLEKKNERYLMTTEDVGEAGLAEPREPCRQPGRPLLEPRHRTLRAARRPDSPTSLGLGPRSSGYE